MYVNPLIFTGLSIAVAYSAGLFNIGAEGQIIVGMLASAFIGFKFAGLPRLIHLPPNARCRNVGRGGVVGICSGGVSEG